jgi:hypothetical protein
MFPIWELFIHKQIERYYQHIIFNIREKNEQKSHKFGKKMNIPKVQTINLLSPTKFQFVGQFKGRGILTTKGENNTMNINNIVDTLVFLSMNMMKTSNNMMNTNNQQ